MHSGIRFLRASMSANLKNAIAPSKDFVMTMAWAAWRPFPLMGARLDAPVGPGVYEVRDANTGETVAFDHSSSLVSDLAKLRPDEEKGFFHTLFGRRRRDHGGGLEFRVWPAASAREAKTIAGRLRSQRDIYMRHRSSWGRA